MATENSMGHNEVGVIGDFKKTLRDVAQGKNRHFDEFPLGSQDRLTLADDLWVTYDNFAIVESKWSQDQLASERKKLSRVRALCEALMVDPKMADLHARCHRIAWKQKPSNRLITLEYRKAVCGSICPDTCKGLDCTKGALTVDDFAEAFFGEPPQHCIPAVDFQSYVKWLTQVVAGAKRDITVLARAKDGRYTISEEKSLQELSDLLPKRPQPKAGGTPGKRI
jgi:hypothetical protein